MWHVNKLSLTLQSGNVENPWLSAMSSHFAYWASPDVALFILRALHHQDVRLGAPKEAAKEAAKEPSKSASGSDKTTADLSAPATPTPVKAGGEGFTSPKTPSSPLSPASRSGLPTSLSQASVGSKSPREDLPRGLSDPEDWW